MILPVCDVVGNGLELSEADLLRLAGLPLLQLLSKARNDTESSLEGKSNLGSVIQLLVLKYCQHICVSSNQL